MERPCRLTPSLAVLSFLFGLSVLTSCAKSVESRCTAFSREATRLQDAGDNRGAIAQADLGLKHCRGIRSDRYWQFSLVKAEALTALGLYDEALRILDKNPPSETALADVRAHLLLDKAWVFFRRAEYRRALLLLDSAEKEAQADGLDKAGRLEDIQFARVYIYGAQGDFDSASRIMTEVGQAPGASNHPQLLAAYAWLCLLAARYEEAARYYELALPGFSANGDRVALAAIYTNLGDTYHHLGDSTRAVSMLSRAEPILRQTHADSELRVCLNTMALEDLDRGRAAQATARLKESLEIARRLKEERSEAEVLNNLALAAVASKKWDAAAEYNRRALAIKRRRQDPDAVLYSLLNAARIMEGRHDFDGALTTLNSLTERKYLNPAPRIDAEVEYIAIYRQLGDEARARLHYQNGLELSERVRSRLLDNEHKLAYYDSQNSLNQQWVRLLVEENHVAEALDVAETSRARLMLERLERDNAVRRLPHPDFKSLARRLKTTLVSYWLAPEESYAWVVTPQSIRLARLAGERKIDALVDEYRATIENLADPLASSGTGDRLRNCVLDPIRPFLNGAQDIILVPDGPLHSINFEALPVDGHYWIDDVTLSVAPSLRVLAMANPKRLPPDAKSVFVVGDALPSPGFPRLPKAAAEMQAIVRTFSGHASVLRGNGATPSAYLDADLTENYVHFAAHATANAERPLESAVILSPGRAGDRLTAKALLQKPIRADLVTISACHSAGVRSYHGEGLVGLAWVFLQTGAHGVIAGLWNASDSSTAALMADLYSWISRNEEPARALRQAKLALVHAKSQYRLPYYWAPFQYYVGAGRR